MGRNILIVDSSAPSQAQLKRTLAPWAPDLVAVDSRSEALEWADRRRFDLIVINLDLPEQDAAEFASTLRARPLCRQAALLIVSAAPGIPVADARMEEPITAWIPTPLDPAQLLSEVAAALDTGVDAQESRPIPGHDGHNRHKVGSARPQRPRLLLVDDDESVRSVLSRSLQAHFDVTVAADGATALSALATTPFPAAIVDLHLPGMDGGTLLRRMRECAPHTSRIVLSGDVGLDAALDAVNEGNVFRILQKPCSRAILIQAAEDAVEQFRLVTNDESLNARRIHALTEQLLDSERIATLGTLASGIGHELRNIYAAYRMALDMLHGHVADSEVPDDEVLGCLERVADHLKVHAEHLHTLGCPAQSEDEQLDLATEIGRIAQMLSQLGLVSGIELQVDLPEDKTPIELQRVRLEQTILNLVKNAKHAMEGTGRHKAIRLSVSVDQTNGTTTLSVRDTGSGMDEVTVKSAFEPYFTTKGPDRGSGLGLATIQQIVEGAGGTITVDSSPGVGTTFALRFPLAQGDAAAA